MYCKKCGAYNDEDSVYCKKCGASLLETEIEDENNDTTDDGSDTKSNNKTKRTKKVKKQKKVKQQKQRKVKQKKDKNDSSTKKGMTVFQKFLMFILFVLVLGLIGVLGYVGYKYYTNKNMVEVPNVVGVTYSQAVSRLQEENLNAIKVKKEVTDEDNNNIVLSQNKKSGKKVKKETGVKITVGVYKEKTVTIGNYVGLDIDTVKTKLKSLGLKYNISEKASDTYEEGIVIFQNLKEGAKVKIGNTVNLVVSKAKDITSDNYESDSE